MSQNAYLTNKYLFDAQNLLVLLVEKGGVSSAQQNSLEAAVLLCLNEAWLAWLNELAGLLNYKGEKIEAWTQFVELSVSNLPDGQYLINLKQQPHTWLSRLLAEKHRLEAKEPVVKQNAENPMQIDIRQVESDSHGQDLSEILRSFKEYVSHARAQHVEY